jgi:hypothetical protein
MRRLALLIALVASLLWASIQGPAQAPAQDPVTVARRFLPPESELAELSPLRPGAGKSLPAVLTGHVLDPHSSDIVFAYYSPRYRTTEKTLFLTLLHLNGKEYQKVYTFSYRSQVLYGPDALRVLRLKGSETDAVGAIVAGPTATAGGQLRVFLWVDPWGWQNVFPANNNMHYFYFYPYREPFEIALSAADHRGANGMPTPEPPPAWYRWDGKRFVKIAPTEEVRSKGAHH